MTKTRSISALALCLILVGCDFYEYEINEDYSLCAVDTWDNLRLCRVLGDGNFQGKLEPAIVAVGHNDDWISLRQCFDGAEGYYSVDAHATVGYNDPVYSGPFDHDAWTLEAAAHPEQWPTFVETYQMNIDKHCPASD